MLPLEWVSTVCSWNPQSTWSPKKTWFRVTFGQLSSGLNQQRKQYQQPRISPTLSCRIILSIKLITDHYTCSEMKKDIRDWSYRRSNYLGFFKIIIAILIRLFLGNKFPKHRFFIFDGWDISIWENISKMWCSLITAYLCSHFSPFSSSCVIQTSRRQRCHTLWRPRRCSLK